MDPSFNIISVKDSVRNIITSNDRKSRLKNTVLLEASSLITKMDEKFLNFERPFSLSPKKREAYLLPPLSIKNHKKKTLVLDLDETLVHSTFERIENYDCIIKIDLDCIIYDIYVVIRPGVASFLQEMAQFYELVIYTASLEIYASPLISFIDKNNLISYRLYREHCLLLETFYIKDLSILGRDLRNVVIIDNCSESFSLNTYNGITIKSWYGNKEDNELKKLIPFLRHLNQVPDVRKEIFKFVYNDTLTFEKTISDNSKTISDNLKSEKKIVKKNHKSNSYIPIASNIDFIDSKPKKEIKDSNNKSLYTTSSYANTLLNKYRNHKVNNLKNFNSIVLKKKEILKKKVCMEDRLSFSRQNNNTPILKNNNEPTNTTLNYSYLETTVNKASHNSSNNGNKQQSSNSNNINIITGNSSRMDRSTRFSKELINTVNRSNIIRKAVKHLTGKKERTEGGRSVILTNSASRTRNCNPNFRNSIDFQTYDKSLNYHTYFNELERKSRNTPTYDKEKYQSESKIKSKSRENSTKKSKISQNTLFNSFFGNKEITNDISVRPLLTENKKELSTNKGFNKKHNVSFTTNQKPEITKNQIMSFCRELLLKNEAQFSSLFNKPKCKKKIVTNINLNLNPKKKTFKK